MPAAHGEHCAAPSDALNEPGAHGDGAAEPVEHELPAGQAVHSEAAVRVVALEKVDYVSVKWNVTASSKNIKY